MGRLAQAAASRRTASASRRGPSKRTGEQFQTLKEAKVLIDNWRLDYNHHRPHSSLDYQTPAAFAASCAAAPLATLGQPPHTKEHSAQLS